MRIVFFQNHALTLSFDSELKTGYAVWNGFLSSSELKEATLKCVELIEKEGLIYWLADNRKMKAIRQADQVWFMENIIPRLLHSSLQRMATLVSYDIFNKMAVENMLQKLGHAGHLVMRDFHDEGAALSWLSTQAKAIPKESEA